MMSEDFHVPPTLVKDNRMLAIGLSVAAALCMLYGAFSHRWLANGNRDVEIGFGLRTNFACSKVYDVDFQTGVRHGDAKRTDCEWHTNREAVAQMAELEHEVHEKLSSPAFVPAGQVTLIAIFLAAAGLLAAAAMGFKKIAKDLPIAPTTIAILGGMIGLISGCVFVATKPGPVGMVGVGISFWLFGIGVVMGIVGAQMLAKVIRPPDPEWTA